MLRTTYLHSGWEFAEAGWQKGGDEYLASPGWLSAQVPGHVHVDLVKHGIIADPFSGMNELGCQWIDERDWSYRTTFEWRPDPENPRRILHFEGLDTVCEVFLNDAKIADHDNMFLPLEADVTESLVAGTNTIRIDFQSAVRVGRERREAYFKEQGLPLDTERFSERPFIRKAQYMSGWDWGPRLVSCGVWKPVKLVECQARIADVKVQAKAVAGSKFRLDIESSWSEGSDYIVLHEIIADGQLVDRFHDDGGCEIHIPARIPQAPIVAHVVTSLFDGTVEEGELLDEVVTPIPTSSVQLLQEADEYGESFEFVLNGKKIWARGANWIPDHSFPSTVTRAQYRDRLEKAKDMGFNMLRVWGGGLYESDDFYELCDELGILVWQDFPFGCSYYPDTGAWLDEVRKEAEFHVKRLRNHPCLALWCGNNENEEMNYSKWGRSASHPPRYYGENFYNDVLPDAVARLDPKTSYIRTSPIGNAPVDDPVAVKQQGPNSGGYGDQHCWDVWHGRGDWKHYAESTGRFSSEYGFGSSCSLATWDKVLDEWAEDYPFSMDDAVLKWHDKTRKGWETFVGYTKLHYPESKMLSDWVYYSQLNQRDALRLGVEHYRRSAFCRGSLIWQLNDCWPVQSWAILDSDGNYKALAYELRRLYADHLLSIERHNDAVKVHAINDDGEDVSDSVSLDAYELSTGKHLGQIGTASFELGGDDRKVVLEASVKGLSVPDTLLVASWGENLAWQLLAEPKNARFAPPTPIEATLHYDGFLVLSVSQPVVDLMVTDTNDVQFMVDNFATVPQAAKFALRYEGDGEGLKARSLAGWHEVRVTKSPI
ncbi:MAG: glycoside hydrolase family 2 protein [Chlorobia bacterium]|nr:glycoside hydrolase family 2 protein [Fimbriimonadaceae bacterium]